ncbi:MAG: hypothetical protein ACK5OX_01670 [Desertimonas sp.]
MRLASELAADHDRSGEPGLPGSAVIAAAGEVGIPASAVERAIAMERLGDRPGRRFGDRLVGPRSVIVDTRLALPVAETMSRLDEWLVAGHHLRRETATTHQAEWRRRDGLVAAGSRAARGLLGEGELGEVRHLSAVVREDGAGTVVRLRLERAAERNGWLAGGTAVAAATTGAAVTLAVVFTPFIALATPLTVGAGIATARSGRSAADRHERDLRRLLDTVGRRVNPTTLGDELRRRVGRRRR